METGKLPQIPQKSIIASAIILVLLILYTLRGKNANEISEDEITVSLCQVHAHFEILDRFDDRLLLLVLAELKMNDFLIGQPIWGPSDTLIYLCEHRLKIGVLQLKLDKKLNNVVNTMADSSTNITWSCA